MRQRALHMKTDGGPSWQWPRFNCIYLFLPVCVNFDPNNKVSACCYKNLWSWVQAGYTHILSVFACNLNLPLFFFF